MTRNHHQTMTNYQQKTTNGHPCKSNRKTNVSFLVPAPDNYKDYLNIEKYMLQVIRNCLLILQYLCGARKIGSTFFDRLSSQHSSYQQEKSTSLLITFKHKTSWFCYFRYLVSVQLLFHKYIFYTVMQIQLTCYCL